MNVCSDWTSCDLIYLKYRVLILMCSRMKSFHGKKCQMMFRTLFTKNVISFKYNLYCRSIVKADEECSLLHKAFRSIKSAYTHKFHSTTFAVKLNIPKSGERRRFHSFQGFWYCSLFQKLAQTWKGIERKRNGDVRIFFSIFSRFGGKLLGRIRNFEEMNIVERDRLLEKKFSRR